MVQYISALIKFAEHACLCVYLIIYFSFHIFFGMSFATVYTINMSYLFV
jgi:hypothetical protein